MTNPSPLYAPQNDGGRPTIEFADAVELRTKTHTPFHRYKFPCTRSNAQAHPGRSKRTSESRFLLPVNQNGSFAFDRVLKSGEVHKRTRKTKVFHPLMLRAETTLLIRNLAAMEKLLPSPATQSPLPLQKFHRRAASKADQPVRVDSSRISQRPKGPAGTCIWLVLSIAELLPTSQKRSRRSRLGGAYQAGSTYR